MRRSDFTSLTGGQWFYVKAILQKQNRSAGMYKAVLPQTIASIPLPEILIMINTLNEIPSMQSALRNGKY